MSFSTSSFVAKPVWVLHTEGLEFRVSPCGPESMKLRVREDEISG